jgi:hypothetical protein
MRKQFRVFAMISVGLFLVAQAWPRSSATEAQSEAHSQKQIDVDFLWGGKLPALSSR